MAKLTTLEHTLSRLSEEEMKILAANSVRSNVLIGKTIAPLDDHGYWLVKVEVPELLMAGKLTELIQKFTDASIEDICKQRHAELFSFVMWVKDELEALFKLEKDYLSTEPDIDLINAGIRELDKLGEFNTIDNLVKEWQGAYTHDEVKAMKYDFIFSKLLKNTIEGKVGKQYSKTQSEKQKNKKK